MRDVDDYCLKSDYTSTVEKSCPNENVVRIRQNEHAVKAQNAGKHGNEQK